MEEIAAVYARSLFEVAKEQDKLDSIREQLGAFADALDETRELQVFFFSPYFSTTEKQDGLDRAVSDADPILVNFLKLLIENHRMPVIFRVRRGFDELWLQENKRLPGPGHLRGRAGHRPPSSQIGDRIAEQTGQQDRHHRRRSSPTSSAASSSGSATRSWTPRSATASNNFASKSPGPKELSFHADQARRDHLHPQVPHRRPRRRSGRPDRGRHRPLGRRRHRPHPRPRELHGLRDARAARTTWSASR